MACCAIAPWPLGAQIPTALRSRLSRPFGRGRQSLATQAERLTITCRSTSHLDRQCCTQSTSATCRVWPTVSRTSCTLCFGRRTWRKIRSSSSPVVTRSLPSATTTTISLICASWTGPRSTPDSGARTTTRLTRRSERSSRSFWLMAGSRGNACGASRFTRRLALTSCASVWTAWRTFRASQLRKTGTTDEDVEMIEPGTGNLLASEAEALVNTVNTVGVMGKGIALQFKNAYPDNFKAYAAACKRGDVVTGKMFVVETGQLGPAARIIINFPTKRHWKGKSRLEYIEAGLEDLIRVLREHKVQSVAIPPLGCGNGGLDWAVVEPKIRAALEQVPEVKVLLHAPDGAPPSDEMLIATKVPNLTGPRAAII